MAYTLSVDITLPASYAGLTLYAQLVDTAGANVGGTLTTGFLEEGEGYYSLTASIPDSFRGTVHIFDAADDSFLTRAVINPQECEFSDVKTSTRSTLTTSQVNAEVDQALADYDPSTRTEATSDKAEILSAVSGLPSAAAIADAVMDEPLTGHTTAGTAGHALQLARAQAAGKWVIDNDTLTLYDLNGSTVVVTFTLSPEGGPYSTRTPA